MAAADVSGKTGIPEMKYEPISAPGEWAWLDDCSRAGGHGGYGLNLMVNYLRQPSSNPPRLR